MKQIEWKPVVGYEGLYEVSNYGQVKKMYDSKNQYEKGYILNPSINQNGYYMVGLYKAKIRKNVNVHRILALAFIENPLNKPCVNHIDGNKLNNSLDNLEWSTYSENNKHAFYMGLNRVTHNNINSINSMIKANSKSVVDLQTGIFYDSLKEACLTTNYKYNKAHLQILRGYKTQRFKFI